MILLRGKCKSSLEGYLWALNLNPSLCVCWLLCSCPLPCAGLCRVGRHWKWECALRVPLRWWRMARGQEHCSSPRQIKEAPQISGGLRSDGQAGCSLRESGVNSVIRLLPETACINKGRARGGDTADSHSLTLSAAAVRASMGQRVGGGCSPLLNWFITRPLTFLFISRSHLVLSLC